jgi:hypothetical protein
VWAASVLVAAAVTAIATFGLVSITPVSRDTDAPQIAVLRPAQDLVLPEGFLGSEGESVGFEFHGLTIVRTNGSFFDLDTRKCLTVVATEDVDVDRSRINGRVYSECRAGSFPATVQMTVDADAPTALRESLGDGTALLFVLDGDLVGVFSDSDMD